MNLTYATGVANYIEDCNLIDIGIYGHPFTWMCDQLQERLGKVLCNTLWQELFSNSSGIILLIKSPYHHGIWLQLCNDQLPTQQNNFNNLEFNNQIIHQWIKSIDWSSNVTNLTFTLRFWNHNTFGNIFLRKKTY